MTAARVSALRPSRLVAIAICLAAVVASSKDDARPNVDDILSRHVQALCGEEAIHKAHSYALYTTVTNGSRVLESLVVYRKAPDKFLSVRTVGKDEYREGFDGSVGWKQTNHEKSQLIKGSDLAGLQYRAEFYEPLNLRKLHKKIEYERLRKSGDNQQHVLRFEAVDGQVCRRYYGTKSFLEVRTDCEVRGVVGAGIPPFRRR